MASTSQSGDMAVGPENAATKVALPALPQPSSMMRWRDSGTQCVQQGPARPAARVKLINSVHIWMRKS